MKTDELGKHAVDFGRERALSYDDQVRRFWAGYGVMQQVIAEVIAAALPDKEAASLLIVGVGTGSEVKPLARYAGAGVRFRGACCSGGLRADGSTSGRVLSRGPVSGRVKKKPRTPPSTVRGEGLVGITGPTARPRCTRWWT
ncbi:hypothetical protein [Sorangium cellulosum]|nr:hypothetical protein [Sorangium cellulosum]